jgi:hypothetical protein
MEGIMEDKKKGKQVKSPGYIVINDNVRVIVEPDSFIVQTQSSEGDKKNWGNNKYPTSFYGLLKILSGYDIFNQVSDKGIVTLEEYADIRTKCVNALDKQIKNGMDIHMKDAAEDIKNHMKKYIQ